MRCKPSFSLDRWPDRRTERLKTNVHRWKMRQARLKWRWSSGWTGKTGRRTGKQTCSPDLLDWKGQMGRLGAQQTALLVWLFHQTGQGNGWTEPVTHTAHGKDRKGNWWAWWWNEAELIWRWYRWNRTECAQEAAQAQQETGQISGWTEPETGKGRRSLDRRLDC